MPSCLNCGKPIEPGKNYCDECSRIGKAKVEELFGNMDGSDYRRKGRRSQGRWLVVGLLFLFLTMLGIALAIAFMLPSGPEFEKAAQAAVCRENLEIISGEIGEYLRVEGEYPPVGTLDEEHVLVVDRYMLEPPACPTTGDYYVLVEESGKVVVRCDSGLEGHDI